MASAIALSLWLRDLVNGSTIRLIDDVTTAAASPPPDQITASAIQQALALARSGQLEQASLIAERALAGGGDKVPLNALLGMFRLDLGDNDAAIAHLEIAHAGRPDDVRIATDLATALTNAGEAARAFDVSSRKLALADPTFRLARIRGFLADQLEDFEAAAESLEHVVAGAPDDWESWNNLGNARRGIRDFDGSLQAFERALELNPLSAPTRLNYAGGLRNVGRFDEAEAEYRKMATDFPDDTKPLIQLHAMLRDLGKNEQSLEAIDAAIMLAPTDVELLLGKAGLLSSMLRMEAAEDGYRKVLSFDPLNGTAYLGLAIAHEHTNRISELADLVAEVDAKEIDADVRNFVRAFLHRRNKEFEEGLAALAKVPPEIDNPRQFHLLGQLLEGAGRFDEAFAAYSKMNDIFLEDQTDPEARAARYRDMICQGRDIVTQDWVRGWRDEAQRDDRPAPVFLVGFPRSGTTLLDTILMGHPRIEVLEEEPALGQANQALTTFEGLPTIPDEEIKRARDAYFAKAAELTPLAPGNLLVDKNPLTMNLLPIVRRIFPEARIILAMRHPCDVVLSCFVSNFRLNDGMSNFIRLDTTAELYDLSFGYFEQVQKLMPLPMHMVRYESIVDDRATELRRLFDFLDLDWHDAVLDHQTTALNRGRIKTASYAQVVEPIYTRSAGRWQKFRKHLEPVLPVLAPWIEKFGYTT